MLFLVLAAFCKGIVVLKELLFMYKFVSHLLFLSWISLSASVWAQLDQKSNHDSIIPAIDTYLFENSVETSLSTLSGVTSSRGGGLESSVNIRGLGGDYILGFYNGSELVFPSENRSIELFQLPAELFEKITVRKSSNASDTEGGIGGSVILELLSPLSLDKPNKFQVDISGRMNDQSADFGGANTLGNRFSLRYTGKFLDETLGVSLGYSSLNQDVTSAEFHGFPWGAPGSFDYVNLANTDRSLSNGFGVHQVGGDETRNALVATLQYQPIDTLEIKIDLLNSRLVSEKIARGITVNRLSGFEIDQAYTDASGSLIGGTFSIVDGTRTFGPSTHTSTPLSAYEGLQLNSNDLSTKDEMSSLSVSVSWSGDIWSMAIDLSQASARGEYENGTAWAHLYDAEYLGGERAAVTSAVRANNLTFTYLGQAGELPRLTFNDETQFSNTNPLIGFVPLLSAYDHSPEWNEETLNAIKLDNKIELGNFNLNSIEFGVRLSNRKYKNGQRNFFYSIYSGHPENANAIPLAFDQVNSSIATWGGSYDHFPDFVAFDAEQVLRDAFSRDLILDQNGNPRDITPRARWNTVAGANFEDGANVKEDTFALYFLINFEAEFLQRPLYGDFGLRSVSTEVESIGIVPADPTLGRDAIAIFDELGQTVLDVSRGGWEDGAAYSIIKSDYSNNLPSLNVNYDISSIDQIHFGLAKKLTRAPLNRLANNINERYDYFDFGGNSVFEYSAYALNSPTIQPFEATQFDLDYSRSLFNDSAVISLSYFIKKMKNQLQTLSISNFSDWQRFGLSPADVIVVEPLLDPVTGEILRPLLEAPVVDGDITMIANVNKSYEIRGLEISYSQTFENLPAPFNTLGMKSTFTKLDGSVPGYGEALTDYYSPIISSGRVPELVENSGNVAATWSYRSLGLALNINYQGEKYGRLTPPSNVENSYATFEPETYIDFYLYYRLANGLGINFKAENITNQGVKAYYGSASRTATIQEFGRSYYLGFEYSF